VAATAFTALVDSLWISLLGLLPHGNGIPTANLVLGLLGLTSTAGLIVRLWRARSAQKVSHRWPVLLALIIDVCRSDCGSVHIADDSVGEVNRRHVCPALLRRWPARSWELFGLRGGGELDFLESRAHAPGRESQARRQA
jgi:hypothetical protein